MNEPVASRRTLPSTAALCPCSRFPAGLDPGSDGRSAAGLLTSPRSEPSPALNENGLSRTIVRGSTPQGGAIASALLRRAGPEQLMRLMNRAAATPPRAPRRRLRFDTVDELSEAVSWSGRPDPATDFLQRSMGNAIVKRCARAWQRCAVRNGILPGRPRPPARRQGLQRHVRRAPPGPTAQRRRKPRSGPILARPNDPVDRGSRPRLKG